LNTMGEIEDPSEKIESIIESISGEKKDKGNRGFLGWRSSVDWMTGGLTDLDKKGNEFNLINPKKDDDLDIKSLFESVKTDFEGLVNEITPERKGQKIMMPPPPGLGAQPQSKNSPQSTSGIPKVGARGGGLNIKEYHKHLTTLITAYT